MLGEGKVVITDGPYLETKEHIFAEGTPPRSFEFASTKALASGVILSTYRPNGPLRTGTMGG